VQGWKTYTWVFWEKGFGFVWLFKKKFFKGTKKKTGHKIATQESLGPRMMLVFQSAFGRRSVNVTKLNID